MKTTKHLLKHFWHEEDGLEMLEYAVLASLIIVAIAAAIPGVTTAVGATLTNLGAPL